MSFSALLHSLKSAGQDYEFYPTTPEIIAATAADINAAADRWYESNSGRWNRRPSFDSLLDIGAGDGATLAAINAALETSCTLYAIEKSTLLHSRMPANVCIIGTDFHEQSLVSKTPAVTFCNPPYSEFSPWSARIIRETSSQLVYLVIPQRWQQCPEIAAALSFRGVTAHIVGAFDFAEGIRSARARVHLLRIDYTAATADGYASAFREEFAELFDKLTAAPDEEAPPEAATAAQERQQLIPGPDYPAALVAIYNKEMDHVRRNYKAAAALDASILKEFGISADTMRRGLFERLTGLRKAYWQELFSHIGPITCRLTTASRKLLLEKLHANMNVDFTVSNIQAVILWALRNANQFISSQFLSIYEDMVAKCNVQLYRSNERAFVEGWRYQGTENTHYKLDFRIVTHRSGGIHCGSNYSWSNKNGLNERGANFLSDLLTIAHNLGFTPTTGAAESILSGPQWMANKAREFYFRDWTTGRPALLFTVRAFQNGNMHFKFNQRFMLALNVEHGRLRGWLRTPAEAADELQDPTAAQYYGATYQLPAARAFNLLAAA